MEEHTNDAKDEEDAARFPVCTILNPSSYPFSSLLGQGRYLGQPHRKSRALPRSEFVDLSFHLLILSQIAVYAALSSMSLSLLATGIDSVFDLGSNVLLFWSTLR